MLREKRFPSIFLAGMLLLGACFGLVMGWHPLGGGDVVHAAPAAQVANHVVISEFRTRGQNGASDEFIELFNPSSASVDIGIWSIKRSAGCSTASPSVILTFASGATLDSGQHYLIANSAFWGTYTPTVSPVLPVQPDRLYSQSVADNGGIALFDASGTPVDAVGMCATTLYFEGTPLPTLPSDGADRSYERLLGGVNGDCYDTGNNLLDFVTRIPSDPQNLTSLPSACNIATDTPTPTDTTIPPTPTETPISPTPTEISIPPTPTETPIPPTPTETSIPPTPTTVPSLAVLINEVAWAGTVADSNDEWIELYNPGAQAISLTGWKLVALDGSPEIILGGQIAAGGYYLLERTDDNTVSDVPASLIYGGALSNDGEVLKLLAPNESVVDTANLDGGSWPAGSGSPNYASMERRGVLPDSATVWITNNGAVANGRDAAGNAIKGTPGQPNWAYSVTPTLMTTFTPTPTRTQTPTRTPTRTPTMQPIVLVINEFLPHPRSDWNGDGVANVYDEYIEIMNVGTEAVSLKNWKLDDDLGGSSPYTLPDITLEPRALVRFFHADTGISLSDGGDTVRLLKSGGQTADIYTYPVVETVDITWCRLPDGNGAWTFACRPTPGRPNARTESGYLTPTPSNATGGQYAPESCPLADTLPQGIIQAECGDWRPEIWNWGLWGESEERWLENRFKWGVFIQ